MNTQEAFDAADAAHRAAFMVFNPVRVAFTKIGSSMPEWQFLAAKKVYDAALLAWEDAERALIEDAA